MALKIAFFQVSDKKFTCSAKIGVSIVLAPSLDKGRGICQCQGGIGLSQVDNIWVEFQGNTNEAEERQIWVMVRCPKETEKSSGGKVPAQKRNSDSLDSAMHQWPPPGLRAASESTHSNTWTNKRTGQQQHSAHDPSAQPPPQYPPLSPWHLLSTLPPGPYNKSSFHCTLMMHNISNYIFLHNLQNLKTDITFWFKGQNKINHNKNLH